MKQPLIRRIRAEPWERIEQTDKRVERDIINTTSMSGTSLFIGCVNVGSYMDIKPDCVAGVRWWEL